MSTITRKNKLYFTDKNGCVRNLAKAAPYIYYYIFNYFINEGGNKEYNDINKNVERYNQIKPLEMKMPEEFREHKVFINSKNKLLITYNNSFKKLVILT